MRGLMRASASNPLLRPRIGLRHSSSATPATIADTGFWKSLIPKPLRKENRKARAQGRPKEWNPATYFIVMFLFIGSMSIQMITLRKQMDQHTRQSAVRIGLLRDVVEKIRNGEEVDVEKVLGTGDAQREADWEEMLQAIEQDEAMRKPQKQEKPSSESREIKTDPQAATSEPQPSKTKTASLGSFF
ncbi:hypothetical protein HRG_006048 [Hirsutella rhossiliensis]|uniref:Uncharacterized protein n=1 Tax=Hirsutella rhossiliensis TaxID=111463 RepID=A0A9P8MWT5_9HYPO|nr:uncharacterized protein HRG_06048 [Hirsutella rhossiliensis]KAH0963538.1 hypothetical protein HRG_06048 [Hirsutella rhossiliensis]